MPSVLGQLNSTATSDELDEDDDCEDALLRLDDTELLDEELCEDWLDSDEPLMELLLELLDWLDCEEADIDELLELLSDDTELEDEEDSSSSSGGNNTLPCCGTDTDELATPTTLIDLPTGPMVVIVTPTG